ncbi:MAG: response regulator [Lachnospiraceae bacterium]|nr:response regulator [Lachnospiraceae bacterium]
MYRVMLIDDELPVRKLMLSSIDWASLDMEVVGEAASGIEAINVIDDMRPDIAFVDISMPFMNGIEFTEVATKNYPELIIIIMTAFDQFEYARKCVSLPVFDYMLKPLVRTEVTETLLRAKARLDARLGDRSSSLVFGSAIPQEDSADEEASVSEQIMRYIEANYTDSCVNLTSVAQQFGFSSSYLSRKFKQETGRNFLEYLTECRMKKAIELAENNVKMYKASAAVGIPDPNYFGRCFKKYTGKGYSEYVK